ncbi:MAG: histidine kinase dimerization/phosphoacceptor domain-containing protein [Bacteroidota bacterium]
MFAYFTITIFRNQRRHYKALQARFLAEISLLEKERMRIAHDLHDELGPLLSVIRIQTSEGNEVTRYAMTCWKKPVKILTNFRKD